MSKPIQKLVKAGAALVLVGVVVFLVALPRFRNAGRFPITEKRSVDVSTSERYIGFAFAEGVDPESLAGMAPGVEVRLADRLDDRRVGVLEVATDKLYDALSWLRYREDILWAYPVQFVGDESRSEARYIVTPEFVVSFKDTRTQVDWPAFARSFGAEVVETFTWLRNSALLRMTGHADPVALCRELSQRDDVAFAHPNWLRKLTPRELIPNDPLFGNQWHLRNTGQGGGLWDADINATDAWDLSLGTGLVIAVIDTGVDPAHVDITQTAQGYNPQTGAGVGNGADNASHGTCVAGVAAGKGNNGTLLSGVAPGATVMPIRLLAGSNYGTPTEEAACFVYAVDHGADVITNSWGPDGVPFLLPSIVQQSFTYVVNNGRSGKGCAIFWAAGNGNEAIAGDQYVASPMTIAVGATTNLDLRAAYSDFGPELDLVAPSSGGTRNINTVLPGNTYTSNFGGTSASAPQAAGTAALMLQRNPQLTWIQIRDLLRSTAEKIQPTAAGYNSGGHSATYGYGRLDAFAAVTAAIAALPPAVSLSVTTNGTGSVVVAISQMAPGAEFLLGVSTQIIVPVGSGPVFGIGADAIYTLSAPLGRIPLHYWADPSGSFYWGAVGVPPGFACQCVAIEIQPGFSFRASNVVHVNF